eukprot:Nk52_evm28s2309 gene=Nk52_evmTU28s2309
MNQHAYIFTSAGAFFAVVVALILVVIYLADISSSYTNTDFLWQQWFVSGFVFINAGLHTFLPLSSRIRPMLPFLHTLSISWSFDNVKKISNVVIDCSGNIHSIFKGHMQEAINDHCVYFDIGMSGFLISMLAHFVYLASCIIFKAGSSGAPKQQQQQCEQNSNHEGSLASSSAYSGKNHGTGHGGHQSISSTGFKREVVQHGLPPRSPAGGGSKHASASSYSNMHPGRDEEKAERTLTEEVIEGFPRND